jgi:uncharacterized protein YndB with AHSA1/START domain
VAALALGVAAENVVCVHTIPMPTASAGGCWIIYFKEPTMANPLKMLKLKAQSVQFIMEVPIAAPPKKVWSTLLKPSGWFFFDPQRRAKHTLDVRPGGLWTSANPDGSAALMGTVVYVEPGKLLRIAGQLGMTHVPVSSVIIFELQPQKDGIATLLRIGTRMFGFMDPDVKKHYQEGWKNLFGQLKAAAEG